MPSTSLLEGKRKRPERVLPSRRGAAAPTKSESPPLLAKAAGQAKPLRSTAKPAALTADDGPLRYGFTALRDNGGAIVLRVARDGREACVVANGTTLLRLRPAAEHPELAGKVAPENRLLVSEWAERPHELRALVAWGVPIILRSGKREALGTLDEGADLKLVRAARRRLYKRVKGKLGKALQDGQASMLAKLEAINANLRDANHWAQRMEALMRELPEKCLPEPYRKQIDLLLRERAYEGERAKVAKPKEQHLPRY